MFGPRYVTFLAVFLFLVSPAVYGQTLTCPPNIDFETGTLNNWTFYTGTCCPVSTPVMSGPVANRHTLVSGNATDMYGGFPIVAPNGGGSYSLKLGNTGTGAQAEKARYYITVPANQNNYSLIYRYAVVFQNPGHPQPQQPRFDVNVYDAATNLPIACNQFSYVSSANLPGFQVSPQSPGVYYKPWTTASLDLSGLAGQTIIVDFATGDCAQGGHFGYGYVDMSCGLFAIQASACAGSPISTLTGPAGYQSYEWYDASFATLIGTGQNVSIPTPANSTIYKVVLTPYPGYGCPDTLSTVVVISDLAINLVNADTILCNGSSLQLNTTTSNGFPPVNFSWSPPTGLSCLTCPNPVVTPTSSKHYVVSVSDSTGCVLKDSVYVGVTPDITLTVQDIDCFGFTNGSISSTVLGIPPFSYSWNTTPPQFTTGINNLPAGSYTLTVTDSLACTQSKTGVITQPVSPLVVNVTNVINASCKGGTNGAAYIAVTGGTGPYTYSWNTTPVKTTQNITGMAAGTYTVTVTDTRNCIQSEMITITEPAQPVGVTISGSGTACAATSTGSLTAAAVGGTPPYTYVWSTTPIQTTATATGLGVGSYTVTVHDSKNCIATATASIGTLAPWTASVTSMSPVKCFAGYTGSATVTPNGGTPPYSYLWNTTPIQTGATATGLAANTYTVIVTDNSGCKDTVSVPITQPTFLSALPSATGVSCNGLANGSATVTATGGVPPYTYSWNTVPPQTTQSVSNLSPGPYTVTITDSNGCTKSANLNITQPATLQATISNFQNVSCFNGQNGTANTYVTGGTPPYSYTWTTSPVQTTANAVNLAAGTYTVNVLDSRGCTTSQSVTITQPAAPLVATISAVTDASCFGGVDGTATVAGTGGTLPYTYMWYSSPAQTTAKATGLAQGTYNVRITDAKGCISNITATINQPAKLNVTATVQQHTCPGMSDGIIVANTSGGVPPYAYQWNTTPVQVTPTVQNLKAGVYIVTATDAHSCIGYATVAVNEFDLSLFAGNDTTICAGDSILLAATGGIGYTWTPATGLKCANCQNTLAYPATSTLYLVTARDQQYNCLDTDDIMITVVERQDVSVGDSLNICDGDIAVLSARGGSAYSWSPAADLDTNWKASPHARPLKDTRYQVIITENECFKDTLFQNVRVYPAPTIDLGPDITIIANEEVQLNAKVTLATKITWLPADGLSCDNCIDPVARVNGTTTYIAIAETNDGCKAVDSVTISISCDATALFIPNTFSPNGDGMNDVFYPRGPDIKSLNYFRIYNRWGEKVFEVRNVPTNDPSRGWDGTFKGVKVDPDVFIYTIEFNCTAGKTNVVKGDVTVLK